MGVLRTKLILHKDITSGTKDETQTYTPAGGCVLKHASIAGAYDLNCVVKIEFDGALIWSGKGGEILQSSIDIAGDGVKIVKLVLDATDLPSGSAILGGEAHFEEET